MNDSGKHAGEVICDIFGEPVAAPDLLPVRMLNELREAQEPAGHDPPVIARSVPLGSESLGLEPHWGLYHQPRHGRPALALDIMEPLRPLIADSAVITAINTGMVRARNFQRGGDACLLHPAGRKALIQAFEARLDHLVTHPAFDYRCSWRAAIRLHARLLARYFRGDIPQYFSITTR